MTSDMPSSATVTRCGRRGGGRTAGWIAAWCASRLFHSVCKAGLAVAGFFLRIDQPRLAGAQRRFVAEGAAIGADPAGAFGAASERRLDRLALQPSHQESGDEAVAGAQRVDHVRRDDAL